MNFTWWEERPKKLKARIVQLEEQVQKLRVQTSTKPSSLFVTRTPLTADEVMLRFQELYSHLNVERRHEKVDYIKLVSRKKRK